MKTTEQTLSDQQLFLLAHRRHHHFVHFARIFMLLLFLTVLPRFLELNGIWLAVPGAEILTLIVALWTLRKKL